MAASKKDFLLRSVLHLGAISLWLLITVSGWLLRFLIASEAWRGCEGFFITELSLASILCSVPLLDCIQIGPNNDAGLTWFGLFLCAMRAPSRQHTTATHHWPPPSAIHCSGEVSRCLMTLASRNKVGSSLNLLVHHLHMMLPVQLVVEQYSEVAGDLFCLTTPNVVSTGPLLFFLNATTISLVSEVSSWRRLWSLRSTKPPVVLLYPPSLPPTIRPKTAKSSENFWWK